MVRGDEDDARDGGRIRGRDAGAPTARARGRRDPVRGHDREGDVDGRNRRERVVELGDEPVVDVEAAHVARSCPSCGRASAAARPGRGGRRAARRATASDGRAPEPVELRVAAPEEERSSQPTVRPTFSVTYATFRTGEEPAARQHRTAGARARRGSRAAARAPRRARRSARPARARSSAASPGARAR